MDRIERNDPYVSPGATNAGPMFPDDSLGIPPLGSAPVVQDAFYYIRLGGTLLGALVILAGLYFAALSFNIVSDVLRSPQQLNAYLDEWYVPLKEETPNLDQSQAVEPEVPKATGDGNAAPSDTAGARDATTPANAETSNSSPVESVAPAKKTEAVAATESPQAESDLPPGQHREIERLKEVAAQRRTIAAKPKNDSPFAQSIELLTDALTRGGLPRLAGALMIVLLVSMLIRIPFGLIKAGTDIVKATLPEKSRSNR